MRYMYVRYCCLSVVSITSHVNNVFIVQSILHSPDYVEVYALLLLRLRSLISDCFKPFAIERYVYVWRVCEWV